MTEPTTTTTTLAELLDGLTDDGDTVELEDGRVFRLRIEADDMSIMDEQGEGVWCGKLAWDEGRTRNDYGYRYRPDGFNGRAEVIYRDGSDRLWWQVPGDVEIGSEGYRSLRSNLREIIEYGYQGYIVEQLDGEDAYHRPIVVNVASLWAIEPFADDGYKREVIGELLAELGVED